MPHRLAIAVRPALAACALTLGLGAVTASAQTEGKQGSQSDSGFELVIVGGLPGFDREQFSKAVLDALPTELTDPTGNFTQSPAYKNDEPYRLIMVFHGDEPMEQDNLCASYDKVQVPPASPPTDLMTATRVTSAFCRGGEMLSRAEDRMVGSIEPGQAGFKFLVADVTKQLFPDGFAELPGTLSSGTSTE